VSVSSGTDSPGLSRTKGRETVVLVVVYVTHRHTAPQTFLTFTSVDGQQQTCHFCFT